MHQFILTIILCVFTFNTLASEKEDNCSSAVEQISSAKKYVSSSNYVFELKKGSSVNYMFFWEKPASGMHISRWRLIERPEESLNYCIRGEGEKSSLIQDLHKWDFDGKFGMPGSGFPRCGIKNENGIPASINVRAWASRELGDSLVYSLPNESGQRDYIFLTSTDSTGAWIILDSSKTDVNDTCYFARGESSRIYQDLK